MIEAPEDVNRETNEVVTSIDGMRQSVDALAETMRARTGVFDINLVAQQTHVRMRAKWLVFSVSAGASVTFRFGQKSIIYDVPGAITLMLPAPITVVDRGTDIVVAVSAGLLRSAYLTYLPE